MKGEYSTKRLILVCIIILGVTAIVLAVNGYFGYGKILYWSTFSGVFFIVILILWAVQEAIRGDGHNKDKWEIEKREEKADDHNRNLFGHLPEANPKMIDSVSSDRNEKEEIPMADNKISKMLSSQKASFSCEKLIEIYNYSLSIKPEERKRMLDEFREYKQKLEFTEKAKSEFDNLKKGTALLRETDNARAEFLLYNKQYLVPHLDTYLNWEKERFDGINEALQDRMFNYIFSYAPSDVDNNMHIARLVPAKVTENGKGEYFIEDEDKGTLYFER